MRTTTLLLSGLLAGCSSLSTIQLGYQSPFDEQHAPDHRGTMVNVHVGQSWVDAPVGVDMAFRTKFGEEQGQWGMSLGLYAFTLPSVIGAYARAGINALQFELWDDTFVVGMGSPWMEGGIYFIPDGRPEVGGFVITMSAQTGYDLRFGDAAPDTGWWAATMGFGWLLNASR